MAVPGLRFTGNGIRRQQRRDAAASPQRLFIGPWALPAPPWGSVWLDKESVLFGDSTLALREWMRASGIALALERNEPEDHFGTLLLLAAWLCETNQDELFAQLLARICCRGPGVS